MKNIYRKLKLLGALGLAGLLLPSTGWSHCDSLEGPVILQAREALDAGEVAAVLKWVPAAGEAEIHRAFEQAVAVRKMGGEAAELADRYFFETLVRVHREGEGAAYTGLRPVGDLDPVYLKADQALEGGDVQELASAIARHVEQAIVERFEVASAKRSGAEANVAAGRAYVEAYVEYMHLVEAVHGAVTHGAGHAH